MEQQINADERRRARTVAIADRVIEDILSNHDDELEAFIGSDSQQFNEARTLIVFERARRRAALMKQIEDGHQDCERQNVERVVTWAWAGVMGLGLLALFLVVVGAVQAVRYLVSLF